MKRIDFNRGWTFRKLGGDAHPVTVNLPHDAMLTETRDPNSKNGSNTAWFPGGKYSYKKRFAVPPDYVGGFLALDFQGIYGRSEVLVNGESVCKHAYGYTGFYAVPENLNADGDNEVEVIVDNSGEPNSRWYTGSGIYREVSLLCGGKIHILPDGVKVSTVSIEPAAVRVRTDASGGEIHVEIKDADGRAVASGKGPDVLLDVPDAKLWSEDTPYLYTVHVRLTADGEVADTESAQFGIRTICWDAQSGLKINGRETKLRGSCIHHDNGILGACAFRDAEFRKVRLLKEAGFNAIRSAHNPCSKAMLDACDIYGVYMMDESFDQWVIPKNRFDYAKDFDKWHLLDLKSMVDKDYNHPSVIMYSIGNEVSETQQQRGIDLTREMSEYIKAIDDTRPVTCGINLFLNGLVSKGLGVYKEEGESINEKMAANDTGKATKLVGSAFYNKIVGHLGTIKNWISKAKFADRATKDAYAHLDICGYNYGTARYEMDGRKYPERVIVGSETFIPDLYDIWKQVKEYPYLIGDFMWTAWDYLGEAGIGIWSYGRHGGFFSQYPTLTAGCGAIDITGKWSPVMHYIRTSYGLEKKPHIGVRPVTHTGGKVIKSPWRNTDAIESWSWPGCEGKLANVEVYTDAAHVRLQLNGKILGETTPKKGIARFSVPYEPGGLVAETFNAERRKIGETSLTTAGKESRLEAVPETTCIAADGQSLCYINIGITDGRGIMKMFEDKRIRVAIEGAGILQGLGSANPCTEETFTADEHFTYCGRAQAIIRSSGAAGNVNVSISADGLEPVTLTIEAK